MSSNGKKAVQRPWYEDGRPDCWITAGRFALLMNRSPQCVHQWVHNGMLIEFGFAYYRDITGRLHIRISDADLAALRKIEHNLKSQPSV